MANTANSTAGKRTTIGNWSPYERHVQNDIPGASQFIDAKTVLVAAGPAKLANRQGADIGNALPIGVMENIAVSQNKTIQRIFEIGSVKSYFVPGRMIGQVSFGRTLYDGASLLKVLYGYHSREGNEGSYQIDIGGVSRTVTPTSLPGRGDMFMNLASELFNHPFGLLLIMVDNELDPYGSMYLEDCHLQGHQLSINSQSTVLVEGGSAQFDTAIPVKIDSLGLALRGTTN
jgi:hypothetical protein